MPRNTICYNHFTLPLSEYILFIVSILAVLVFNYFAWFRGWRENRSKKPPQGCFAVFIKPFLEQFRRIPAIVVLIAVIVLYLSEIIKKGL
jgi:hypothetical protein